MASLDANARQQMLAQINSRYGMILTPADVSFAAPVLVDAAVDDLSDPDLRNSSVTITTDHATAGVRLTATIKYNRLKLPGLFQLIGTDLEYADEASSHDLIPKLNTLLGVELIPADIQDLPVTADGDAYVVTLRATASSLACFGEVELTLLSDTPPDLGDNLALWFNDQSQDSQNYWFAPQGGDLYFTQYEDGSPVLDFEVGGRFYSAAPTEIELRTQYFFGPSIVGGVTKFQTQVQSNIDFPALEAEDVSTNIYFTVVGHNTVTDEKFIIGQVQLVETAYDEGTGQYSYTLPEVDINIDYTFQDDWDLNTADTGISIKMLIGPEVDPINNISYGIPGYTGYGTVKLLPFSRLPALD